MNFARPLSVGSRAYQEPLDEDQLRKLAPSIFAPDKHDSRSDRYTYIPTWEIVRELMNEGFEPMHATQGRSRIEGKAAFTKHMVRFRHGTAEMRQVGDTRPEIVLINSHDGTSSYRIMAGLFRLICLNGMVVSDALVDDVRVGHSGKIADKVLEGTWSVVSQVDQVMRRPVEWAGVDLSQGERLAIAKAAHELRFEDTSDTMQDAIKPVTLLVPRRHEDMGDDLWSTFNRLQENVIRGGVSGRGRDAEGRIRNVTTRPVRNIDQDVKLNRALWVLAEEMAKLKTAA